MQISGGSVHEGKLKDVLPGGDRQHGAADMRTATYAFSGEDEPQHPSSGFKLPLIGGVQLAVFIGVVTGGLILISLLLVTLLTLARRNRRKEKPTSTPTVTSSANVTSWSNTERLKSPAITRRNNDIIHGIELSSQSDMDSYSEDDALPSTFTSVQVWDYFFFIAYYFFYII